MSLDTSLIYHRIRARRLKSFRKSGADYENVAVGPTLPLGDP